MTAEWVYANQRAIAGLGIIQDFLAAHAITIPAGTQMIRVTVTTAHAHDVAAFGSDYGIGACVATDGTVFVDMNFAGAVLRIQTGESTS